MSAPATLHEVSTVAHDVATANTRNGSTLLEDLINQQSELTAVEIFSQWQPSAPSTESLYQALMPASNPGPGQQFAFEVDLDKCSGCKACVVACHTLNGLGETETWRKVGLLTSSLPLMPVRQHVTTACHHCIDPGCLKGCPVLAYEKDPLTGIVRHLDDQCFGCKYCTMMCPYEVPQYNSSLGIVRKCDMCSQRLAQGEAPACVQACPTQAIRIALVERSDFRRGTTHAHKDADQHHNQHHNQPHNQQAEQHVGQALVATAPLDHHTLPTTRYISQRLGSAAQSREQLRSRESTIDTIQPGHAPLVGMLVMTQSSVGAWCILAWISLLGLLPSPSMIVSAWVATLVGVIGVHLALLHLGRPWLAFRSFLGWRTSWLSREAIAFGLYMGAAAGSTLACSLDSPLFPLAALVTACIGAVAVVCSAMIYVATGRSLWSLSRTLGEFAATTLGLGLAITSLSLPRHQSPNWMMASGLVCLLAFIPKWIDWHRGACERLSWQDFSGRSGRMLHDELSRCWRVAWSCLAASFSFAMIVTLGNWNSGSPIALTTFGAMWLACVISLFAAQMTLRWLGFASVVIPRMPGAAS